MHSINARYQVHKSGNKSIYVESCWKIGKRTQHVAYSVRKHGWVGAVSKAIEERERSQGVSLELSARSIAQTLRRQLVGKGDSQ